MKTGYTGVTSKEVEIGVSNGAVIGRCTRESESGFFASDAPITAARTEESARTRRCSIGTPTSSRAATPIGVGNGSNSNRYWSIDMHVTQWEFIPDFPDYQISSAGQVRRNGRIKAVTLDRKGYHKVTLWRNAKSHTRLIAPLVAAVFVGEKPVGQVVRHINGIKSNNNAGNLEYGTRSENELDKRRHGTAPIGENHPAAKLTADQVSAIRKRYVKGSRVDGCNALGKDYGVTGTLIHYIVIGKLWK